MSQCSCQGHHRTSRRCHRCRRFQHHQRTLLSNSLFVLSRRDCSFLLVARFDFRFAIRMLWGFRGVLWMSCGDVQEIDLFGLSFVCHVQSSSSQASGIFSTLYATTMLRSLARALASAPSSPCRPYSTLPRPRLPTCTILLQTTFGPYCTPLVRHRPNFAPLAVNVLQVRFSVLVNLASRFSKFIFHYTN